MARNRGRDTFTHAVLKQSQSLHAFVCIHCPITVRRIGPQSEPVPPGCAHHQFLRRCRRAFPHPGAGRGVVSALPGAAKTRSNGTCGFPSVALLCFCTFAAVFGQSRLFLVSSGSGAGLNSLVAVVAATLLLPPIVLLWCAYNSLTLTEKREQRKQYVRAAHVRSIRIKALSLSLALVSLPHHHAPLTCAFGHHVSVDL